MENNIYNQNYQSITPEGYSQYVPEARKGMKRFEIFRKDTVFAVILFLISLITSAFGIFGGFKAGFTLSLILILAAVTTYLLQKKTKIKVFPFVCMLLSVAVSLSFTFTSNGAVRFFSLVSVTILDLIWFVSLVSDRTEIGDLGIFDNIFAPFFKSVTINLPVSVVSLFSGGASKGKKLGKVLLGIAVSLPVLFVVVPLLMSSDEAFSGMIELIFGDLFLTIMKINFGIIIAVFLISYSFSLKKDQLPAQHKSSFKGIENTITISALSVISICYLAYLFSQLAYFFSAFSGFLPENYEFTVSAYARRGFFEMSIIAGINFTVIFLALLLSRKANGKTCVTLRIICTFIGLFTLMIIATAISKMVLYISSFGMTRLRIQTSAFMAFLFVVFVSLIIRLYAPKVRVLRVAFIASAIVLTILGTVNINSFVANYNYNAYKNGTLKEMDVSAIYDLGHEGIPYLVKLTSEEAVISDSAKSNLYTILQDNEYITVEKQDGEYVVKFQEKRNTNWGDYSLPESKAYNELKKYTVNNAEYIIEQFKQEENFLYDSESEY